MKRSFWKAFAWPRFSAAEWLFSAKSFAAAMLAITVAEWAGLPRPFWALLTTYVVAQPLAGTVRSKALFRFCGTLLGSTATVLLVPALSNAPELLALALALWVGGCLYLSLLDRTPRAYVFMLAGYTAALIGFPSVEAPGLIFDTASARVEEILLGILCATLVHSLVLPTGLQPTVLGLLDRALADARQWFGDLLSRQAIEADRRRLATDITQLRMLSTHVPFDTSHLRFTAASLRAMQDHLAALTPFFSAVDDRLQALQQAEGELAPDVRALLAEVARWLDATATDAQAAPPSLQRFIEAGAAQGSGWSRALRLGLATRLEQLLQGWSACLALRADIDTGLTGAAMPRRVAATSERPLHRDHGMAALSALAAVLAIGLACAFWMFTGWPAGSGAAMMAAVFCCFFATMDDPVPGIHTFLRFTLWSVPISALYVLVLLPLVSDIATLALVCAPVFLLLACYVPRPATTLPAMALIFGVGGALSAHDTGSADFASFVNGMAGQVLGLVIAARTTQLVRSVSADWMARRIQRAARAELGELALRPEAPGAHDAAAARMLDRIGLLAPRVAQAAGKPAGAVARDALRDLRLVADIEALRHALRALPVATAQAVAEVLAGVASRFRARGSEDPSPDRLLPQLDAALRSALAPSPSTDERLAVAALVGLRRNLFPDAVPAEAAA